MQSQTVIGLDIGRSAVKVVAANNGIFYRLMFPSLVAPAIEIGIRDAADRAEAETVELDGRRYFTGETAALQGRANMSSGLSDDWTISDAYQVLVLSALKRLEAEGVPGLDSPYLVIGTPSKLYLEEKESLVARTTRAVNASTVRVLPQPMGAFCSYTLNSRGAEIKERMRDANGKKLTWAVVDVGHFTTDFLLMREGVYVQSSSEISCDGVHFAILNLLPRLAKQGIRLTHVQAEEVLRTKQVKHFGQMKEVGEHVDAAVETVAQNILTNADYMLSSEATTLDGILLAGGGAPMIFDQVKKRWPVVEMLEDFRMAVADGYCKFGIGALLAKAQAATKKKDAVAA